MKTDKPRAVQLWMVSNLASGTIVSAFISLLVSPFITQTSGGKAFQSGLVLGIIALVAVIGPYIGKFADAHKAYRSIYLGSMVAMSLSFVLLFFDAYAHAFFYLFAVLIGVAISAQSTLGPAFILGSGQPKQVTDRQMTAFSLAFPCGQIVGAGAVSIGQLAGLGFEGLFFMAAMMTTVATILTAVGIGAPARTLVSQQKLRRGEGSTTRDAATHAPAPKPERSAAKRSLGTTLFSAFGMFLFVLLLGSLSHNGLKSQIGNVMSNVYGFTSAQTSALVALAGVFNIVVILCGGMYLNKHPPKNLYFLGATLRLVGVLAMALVGALGGSHLILAAIAMEVAYQGSPISRQPASMIAIDVAPVSVSEANGFFIGATAFGGFLGCVIMGALADLVGYNAINWTAVAASTLALLLPVIVRSWHRRERGEGPVHT